LVSTTSHAGNIRTRDGKDHPGSLTLGNGDTLTVTASDGSTQSIAMTDIAQANWTDTAATTQPATAAWKGVDLGDCTAPGADHIDPTAGTFELSAAGWGILGTEDSLHFVYQPFHGDGQIIVHIATPMGAVKNPPLPEKLTEKPPASDVIPGITFRQSIDPGSPHAAVMVWLLNADAKFKFRAKQDGLSIGQPFTALGDNGNDPNAPPRPWLRLTRNGNTFAGYSSVDGKYWTFLDEKTVEMPADALVGLAMSAANNIAVGTAAFDHVTIMPGRFGRTYFPGSPFPESGIVLRDGSIISGRVISAGRSPTTQPSDPPNPLVIGFQKNMDPTPDIAAPPPLEIPADRIAVLLFKRAPAELATQLPSPTVTHGILLTTGDQMEGSLDGFDGNQLAINSPDLGLHRFDLAKDAIAVVLNPTNAPILSTIDTPTTQPTGWIVKTNDGSDFFCTSLNHTNHTLVAEVPSVGKISILDADVVQLIAGPAK
jgi:hypothetical protein